MPPRYMPLWVAYPIAVPIGLWSSGWGYRFLTGPARVWLVSHDS